jgi:hypothetical protein
MSAATIPEAGCEITRKRPSEAAARARHARLPSLEPSSTAMHSQRASRWRRMLSRHTARVPSASRTGIRIETRGSGFRWLPSVTETVRRLKPGA